MAWAGLLERMTETIRDTFPASVTYTPEGGTATAIVAVFDVASRVRDIDAESGIAIDLTTPKLTVRLDDLASAPHVRDRVYVAGKNYEVYRVEPDGSGMCGLSLTEVV